MHILKTKSIVEDKRQKCIVCVWRSLWRNTINVFPKIKANYCSTFSKKLLLFRTTVKWKMEKQFMGIVGKIYWRTPLCCHILVTWWSSNPLGAIIEYLHNVRKFNGLMTFVNDKKNFEAMFTETDQREFSRFNWLIEFEYVIWPNIRRNCS